jgi:hypothetical protein
VFTELTGTLERNRGPLFPRLSTIAEQTGVNSGQVLVARNPNPNPMAGDGHSSSSKQHKRELFGWLSYAFASEVFVIVSLTLFLPICLEQFARDNGFFLPDKTIPCSSRPSPPAGATDEDEVRCVVKLGWAWIDTASFRCVCSRYNACSSPMMQIAASTHIHSLLRCKR